MFPLGSVLLPGQVLPLQVFEPRYLQLVHDCVRSEPPEFGVTLIERGSEVGGGDQRTFFGTVARIVSVSELSPDRYAVIAVGTHRVRVRAWFPDDPYPVAEVEDWPDEDPDVPGLDEQVSRLHRRVRRAMAAAVELGDLSGDPGAEISDEPLMATYHLAGLAPVGPADRQRLLGCAGPVERLTLLEALLDDVEAVQRFRLGSDDA
jgi:Lon protease-like protein